MEYLFTSDIKTKRLILIYCFVYRMEIRIKLISIIIWLFGQIDTCRFMTVDQPYVMSLPHNRWNFQHKFFFAIRRTATNWIWNGYPLWVKIDLSLLKDLILNNNKIVLLVVHNKIVQWAKWFICQFFSLSRSVSPIIYFGALFEWRKKSLPLAS